MQRGLNRVMRVLSAGIRHKADTRGLHSDFRFMRTDGGEPVRIGDALDQGTIRPIIDRVPPFAQTIKALAYLDTGHARGKVVVSLHPDA